ncbi:MAG: tetratricopeptide repeat protein, partial [Candidatus Marinimicrobia bacterium]|nr:tetratricopeptide repeat protein [Candidatus Neomarinimicrobiota bacterium]
LIIILILVIIGGLTFFYIQPKQQAKTESIYTDALNAMVRGDKRTALKHLRDVVKQDTNHVDAYLQMGDILREEGNALAAIKIHQSLTVRPNLKNDVKIHIHRSLALDYNQISQLAKARREVELLLKLDKKNLWANEFLLALFEKQQDWDKATQISKIIQKVKQLQDPTQIARFLVLKGMDKHEKGKVDEAIKTFDIAAKTDPNYEKTYLCLGDIYLVKRDLVKAIDNWEKYALLNPENGKMIYSKIEAALFDLGRFSEVEKFYERIVDKDPSNLSALTKLANVLEEKGEHNSALSLVEDALSKNQTSIHAHLMKLKLSLQVSKPNELSNHIDKIIQLLTSNNEK